MGKSGRKGTYTEGCDLQVYKLCLLGLIDEEIAEFFGIRVSTLNNWKKMHPSFMESIKRGKLVADANVVTKLYSRAMGYDYEEVTTEPSGKGEGKQKVKKTIKHMAPDVGAIAFWMKNRQPKLWRERKEVTGANGEPLVPTENYDISKLTKEQRDVLLTIGEEIIAETK